MTTGPIGSSFAPTDPLLAILAKEIEVEQENQKHEDGVRVAARNAKISADQAAIQALHDQADAIRAGAWVSFGLKTAGAVVEGVGIATTPTAKGKDAAECSRIANQRNWSNGFSAGGRMLAGQAEPLGKLVGDANEKEAEAKGAAAKMRSDSADADYDAALSLKQKSETHVNAIIEQVQSLIALARQACDHVLSRF